MNGRPATGGSAAPPGLHTPQKTGTPRSARGRDDAVVAQLQAENAQLRKENAQLKDNLARLRDELMEQKEIVKKVFGN